MRLDRMTLATALALALGAAHAQTTTSGTVPSGNTAGATTTPQGPVTAGPGASAGVPPPAPAAPPVQITPEPPPPNDSAGQAPASQPGFFSPSTAEAVVVPGFTPATPGVMPVDTTTNATVGSSPSDRSLRDAVAAAMTSDPDLEGARINVTVSNGVVSLSGMARDQAQADRARAAAERIAGSARVDASISTGG
jgi:hypothetical protein